MVMRLRASSWAFVVATCWSCLAAAAPAAERLKTAAEEFDAGRRAFKNRDFEGSAVHFENADRDAPSPEALQSAIRARKEAAQPARAATLAALALTRHPDVAGLATYALQVLAELSPALQKLSISCSPDCAVIVDNKVMPFPESPSPTVYLDPGAHTVIADWPDHRQKSVEVQASAGGTTQLAFQPPAEMRPDGPAALTVASPKGDTPTASSSALPAYVFFAGVGVTAVLGGVTAWSGIDTLNHPGKDAIARNCAPPNNNTSCPDYQAGLSNQRRTNILIATTGVVGLTTAVIGIFFTKWGGASGQADKAKASWQPIVGLTDGVTIGAVGSF